MYSIIKRFYSKKKIYNAIMFVTLCVTGSSPLVCTISYWAQSLQGHLRATFKCTDTLCAAVSSVSSLYINISVK